MYIVQCNEKRIFRKKKMLEGRGKGRIGIDHMMTDNQKDGDI
jgi:hypothetical protein